MLQYYILFNLFIIGGMFRCHWFFFFQCHFVILVSHHEQYQYLKTEGPKCNLAMIICIHLYIFLSDLFTCLTWKSLATLSMDFLWCCMPLRYSCVELKSLLTGGLYFCKRRASYWLYQWRPIILDVIYCKRRKIKETLWPYLLLGMFYWMYIM